MGVLEALAERKILTPRWYPLRHHAVQAALKTSKARFKVVPAGRRSGKSEIAKRNLVWAAILGSEFDSPAYFAAAPTYNQAKRIYWDDLKKLVPKQLVSGISESELVIKLITGSRICVVGLDQPARIEGSPWDGGILDEYGNMKEQAWPAHVRPALSDRRGWCWLIGVPEGRNHYYETYRKSTVDATGEWGAFTWKSSEILPAAEIEAARIDLDELTFQQEYEASFITFSGRTYYSFDFDVHAKQRLKYDPKETLIICFDFNVAPGTASVSQEQYLPGCYETVPIMSSGGVILGFDRKPAFGTGVIGEVYIERGSNTPMVCRKLVEDWGQHQGRVKIYGDATGGNKGSAKVAGSDWDLVRDVFKNSPLADKVEYNIPHENPRERTRVNAVNSRLKNTKGEVRMLVDGAKAPHMARDLDGVQCVKGSAGEIDKTSNPMLTHLSDGIGYYISRVFPIGGSKAGTSDF